MPDTLTSLPCPTAPGASIAGMGIEVTDYNAITGMKTGDIELDCPALPPAKHGIIRKAVDRQSMVVKWIMPDGKVLNVKPSIIRAGR